MERKKRLSAKIIFVAIFLILIPLLFLLFVAKRNEAEHLINHANYFVINIASIIGALSTVIGVFAIYFEVKREKDLNQERFLVELNSSFVNNDNIKDVFSKLNIIHTKDKEEDIKFIKKHFKTNFDLINVVEYLSFFEEVENLVQKNVMSISQVNDMFSFRFFVLVNNPFVYEFILKGHGQYFKNIYKLHRSLTGFKKKNNDPIPYERYPLYKLDKKYNEYSTYGYFKEKVDKKMNVLFTIFLVSSLIILGIFFKIFVLTVIDVASLIGAFATIVGAVAIYFQLNEEFNINEARFMYDLSSLFLMNKSLNHILAKVYFIDEKKMSKTNVFVDEDIPSIMDNLVFYETLYSLFNRKILKFEQINDMFSGAFFRLTNNPEIQKIFLLKNSCYFKNIYKLHNHWRKYREDREQFVPFTKYSLEKVDKSYKKYLV